MKQSILILGAGRMVQAIAFDLHQDFELTVADINTEALNKLSKRFNVKTIRLDVSNEAALSAAVKPFDLIIGAVPGQFGYQMLKNVIKCGKNIVDISFAPENAIELDALAKEKGVLAIVDIGVAPGLSNLVLGHHAANMQVQDFVYMVGGLPEERELPYEYKAPFSPIDVIEEYIRPSRIKRNNKVEVLPALSEPELVKFDEVGELEGFITDGLRSLIYTLTIPNMMEKTLRYPGHRALMEIYRETGFFNQDEIDVQGQKIRPIDVTAKLLLPKWKLEENDKEFTVMTIDVAGTENGKSVKYSYLLFDKFDVKTGLSSMARTTGFTCASAARMVLENQFVGKGIFPGELIGKDEACYKYILNHLATHSIELTIKQS